MRNSDYRFDVQLAQGLVAEEWFYELTSGGDRFEVKHDRRALDTGRLYIETEHDPGRRGEWQPCGISTSEADCWIFVLGYVPICFIGISATRLRLLERAARREGLAAEQPYGSCPTRATLVPLAWLTDDKHERVAA